MHQRMETFQVTTQLNEGKALDSIKVPLKLSLIKPLHAGWVVEFYNFMTSDSGKKYIDSGWRAAGITDAIEMGKENLPPIDPFHDLDPLLPSAEATQAIESMIAIPEEQNGRDNDEECNFSSDEDSDSEWEDGERNAFDVFE